MIVLLHGGAAAIPSKIVDNKLLDLRRAAKNGFIALLNNEKRNIALDAVQCAVQSMEDSPYFNAGYGSSLTSTGQVEMDAIIADGQSLNFGAISSVTSFKNPIKVARTVMEQSEHCLFTADGAHKFGVEHGFTLIDRTTMVHPLAQARLDELKTFQNAINCDHKEKEDERKKMDDHDTVGAVAIDQWNNVAAATSTGGITGKQPGRVGDTPVIGSGAYADNRLGAVSTTGHGEAIMRVCLARDVLFRYERNLFSQQQQQQNVNEMQVAVDQSLQVMKERVNGYGGLIAIGVNQHDIAIGYTTVGMPWAYITSQDIDEIDRTHLMNDNTFKVKIHYGYLPGEHFIAIE